MGGTAVSRAQAGAAHVSQSIWTAALRGGERKKHRPCSSVEGGPSGDGCVTDFFAIVRPMPRAKSARGFAEVKRRISPKDDRLKTKALSKEAAAPLINKLTDAERLKDTPTPSWMFFGHNPALGPPFHVLLDTNFINFSVKNKLDPPRALLDCLMAPVTGCVTDCVLGELQKLGAKYRIAQRVARDSRLLRLPCTHTGTYADDCLVERVITNRIYIVGTCDRDLKRRIRKVPGVPIMYISKHQYTVERLPEAPAKT